MKNGYKKIKKYFLVPTRIVVLLLALTFFKGCDKDGDVNFFSIEDDKNLGAQVEQEILNDPAQYPILPEVQFPEAYGHLQRIRDNILNSGKVQYRSEFAWKMHIIRNDSVLNAFCTPGGYIFVYTGIIKFLDSEDQFAGVLGHEIGHADKRHTTDQLTKLYGIDLLLSIALGKNKGMAADIGEKLASLSFSRANEREADDQSVIYLYPTQYDARGASRFFEKLVNSGQSSGVPVFLSTHPAPENRIQNITNKWQSLGGKVGGTFPDTYQQFKNSLPK